MCALYKTIHRKYVFDCNSKHMDVVYKNNIRKGLASVKWSACINFDVNIHGCRKLNYSACIYKTIKSHSNHIFDVWTSLTKRNDCYSTVFRNLIRKLKWLNLIIIVKLNQNITWVYYDTSGCFPKSFYVSMPIYGLHDISNIFYPPCFLYPILWTGKTNTGFEKKTCDGIL